MMMEHNDDDGHVTAVLGNGNVKELDLSEVMFLHIQHYSNHHNVVLAAQVLLDELQKDGKTIRGHKAYFSAAKKLIASIYMHEGDLFRFSTKREYFTGSKRKQVWLTPKTLTLFNTMRDLGFVEVMQEAVAPHRMKKNKQQSSEAKGLTAVYRATEAFHTLLHNVTAKDIEVDTSLPRVDLKTADGSVGELSKGYLNSTSHQETVTTLTNHFNLLSECNVQAGDGKPLPQGHMFYVRKFKEDLDKGGRFYSSFVNQPKEYRLGITFDGEPAGSLDYSQLHPTLLLRLIHQEDKETNLFAIGDVYAMPDYPDLPRSAHKEFINIIFNAETKDKAARRIMTAYRYWNIFEDCEVIQTYGGKQIRTGEPVFPETPLKAALKYIDSFIFRHPMFEPAVSTAQWGSLQLIDSTIIQHVVRMATDLGIPVLPVHDEVIIPVSAKPTIELMLARAFQHVLKGAGDIRSVRMDWSVKGRDKEAVVVVLQDD
jgi:hypothetical protein